MIKIFPTVFVQEHDHTINMFDLVEQYFDEMLILRRRNLLEQLISLHIAKTTGIWANFPGNAENMEDIRANLINNKITITKKQFDQDLRIHNMFEEHLTRMPNIPKTPLYYEDMLTIPATSILDLVNIPHDGNAHYQTEKLYNLKDKLDAISNIDEIVSWYVDANVPQDRFSLN